MKALRHLLFFLVGGDFAGLARCENGIVDVDEKKIEVHFIYLVQTRKDRFTKFELSRVENTILHHIQENYEWSKESDSSIISEIGSSPRDSINNHGFCVPTGNFKSCFVVDGRMSLRAKGDAEDAIARFYNMTKSSMNEDLRFNAALPIDGNLYYYRGEEDKNVVRYDNGDAPIPQQTIVMLLALFSIGIFFLTVIVLFLLFRRNSRTSRDRERGLAQADGQLGIASINYLGSAWLEIKSTSSGSSSSLTLPKKSNEVALPKIVGNSTTSVCCSSVSELSSQTLDSRKVVASSPDLEKIDEESSAVGDNAKNNYPFQTTPRSISSIKEVDEEAQIVKEDTREGDVVLEADVVQIGIGNIGVEEVNIDLPFQRSPQVILSIKEAEEESDVAVGEEHSTEMSIVKAIVDDLTLDNGRPGEDEVKIEQGKNDGEEALPSTTQDRDASFYTANSLPTA